jgi:hypothetical protein
MTGYAPQFEPPRECFWNKPCFLNGIEMCGLPPMRPFSPGLVLGVHC